MDIIGIPFLKLIYSLLTIYYQIIIISFILNLLEIFDIINPHNRFIKIISNVVSRLSDPILSKIRSVVPPIGGIDFSPLILVLAIGYLRDMILQIMIKAV